MALGFQSQRKRFTGTERDAIETLAQTDPLVGGWLAKVRNSSIVHLDEIDVQQGLPYLAAMNCIAADRISIIGAFNT